MREAFGEVDFWVQLSMQSFESLETTSANVNLKPLRVIVNHIVDDSLQDFQARAEDAKSVGKPIFESWLGYAGTLSPVHFARRENVDPPGHTIKNHLQISQTCICLLMKDITQTHNSPPHQSLLEVPTSVKSMTATPPLSCSNIVVRKIWSNVLLGNLLHLKQVTFILGSAFYSPTPPWWWAWVVFGAWCVLRRGETWGIKCLWGGWSAWVGHVYGPCACTHGGCCATQSMGGGW